jgi:hypothetical protein
LGDFASEILKKYGTPAFIFAFVFAGVIWLFAHNAAAPGGDVTILWGLAKYTKKNQVHETAQVSLPNEKVINSKAKLEPEQIKALFSPISLTILHNISKENMTSALSKLREERKLRELSVSESGKKISEIPKGTFFFTLGAWLESDYKWELDNKIDDFLTPFKRYKTKRIRPSENYVEIQYPNSGIYNLILFINEQAASQISQLNGESEHKVMAAIYPWGEMSSMVSLPVNRIIRLKERDVQVSKQETVTVLDIVIR